MRKSLAIFAVFLIAVSTFSMSVSAVSASEADGTLIISVLKKDASPAGNATIEISKNGGGYSRTEYTNEAGDSITIEGVPEGYYTMEAYIPHPTGGKALGIFLWGKAYNNQAEVIAGQDNVLELTLVGGFAKSAQSPGVRPIFSILKAILLRL